MYKHIKGIDSKLWDGLGKVFIEILTPENEGVMAFGMIPVDQYEPFKKMLLRQIQEKIAKDMGVHPEICTLKKETVKDIEHNLSQAIYANAKMVV